MSGPGRSARPWWGSWGTARVRPTFLDEHRMRGLVRLHASRDFRRCLEGRGVPPQVAAIACAAYDFDFHIRDGTTEPSP